LAREGGVGGWVLRWRCVGFAVVMRGFKVVVRGLRAVGVVFFERRWWGGFRLILGWRFCKFWRVFLRLVFGGRCSWV
jgi:hypothetical protein